MLRRGHPWGRLRGRGPRPSAVFSAEQRAFRWERFLRESSAEVESRRAARDG
jgi:hypothetical protein